MPTAMVTDALLVTLIDPLLLIPAVTVLWSMLMPMGAPVAVLWLIVPLLMTEPVTSALLVIRMVVIDPPFGLICGPTEPPLTVMWPACAGIARRSAAIEVVTKSPGLDLAPDALREALAMVFTMRPFARITEPYQHGRATAIRVSVNIWFKARYDRSAY